MESYGIFTNFTRNTSLIMSKHIVFFLPGDRRPNDGLPDQQDCILLRPDCLHFGRRDLTSIIYSIDQLLTRKAYLAYIL
jgi:hypothetical protein